MYLTALLHPFTLALRTRPMIPGPLLTLPMLLLALAPFVAAALTLGLLLRALMWRLRYRNLEKNQRPRFWTWLAIVLGVLAVAGDIWGVVMGYQLARISQRVELKSHYRDSRQRFVLPEDFQYGELVVPQGSLVNKYDAFDNGEPQRPLGLRGLEMVRFAHPVQVAGVWATALDARSGHIEVAREQRIGPVMHFDPQAQDGDGDWVVDPQRPYLQCQQGDVAKFEVPLIDYDIQAEFAKPSPDGPDARFRPSQWRVTECTRPTQPMELKPAYAQPGPKGAQAMVWGPLLPQDDD